MTEHDENTAAILQRLEKIEKLLERMDREIHKDETWKAAFEVKWDQLIKEHIKIQEHVKENWERINELEKAPLKKKAQLWDSTTGKIITLAATAIATAILTHMPSIIKLFLE
jgi:hypothetical protein